MDAEDEAVIREVDPEKAEAVLTLRLFIPDEFEGYEEQYYLARIRPRRPTSVVESRTVNPDGSITTLVTTTSDSGRIAIHCTHGSGRTSDGRGCGFYKSVSILGQSAESVEVSLSVSWTVDGERQGGLDEELIVQWLGTARKELSGGGWVEARITPAGDAIPVISVGG